MANEIEKNNGEIIIYQSEDGVYELIIKPIYRTIRVIIDTPRLGMRKAYMKYFHIDDYWKEQCKIEREEER